MGREPHKADTKADTKADRALAREERQKRRAARNPGGPRKGTGSAETRARPARPEVLHPRGAAPDKAASRRKIIVISFQKTGTTTMTDALRSLGFSVAQSFQAINKKLLGQDLPPEEIDDIVRTTAFEIADRADALQDSPYPQLFKELDARYPGSKFIYLDREPDSWVKSVIGHFGKSGTSLRTWIYGNATPAGNEQLYRQRFLDHRDEVNAYFADRAGDILHLDLAAGDGWLKLVTFLGDDLLPPFPHRNKRG